MPKTLTIAPPKAAFALFRALLAALALDGPLPLPMNAADSPAPTPSQRWIAAGPAVPEFYPPAQRTDWENRRPGIRAQLQSLLGHLPARPAKPQVERVSLEDRGDYTVETLRIDNAAGAVIPAQLLLPKTAPRTKVPAILYCHWHGGEYDKGKVEIWRADHTPEPPGPAFVKRGHAVLVIDAYCFGERNGAGPGGLADKGSSGEMTASKYELWFGRSLWGMMLRDDLIALDYLCQRPEVDAARIGVTGMSMGATRSWWLMALDDRIRAGVAVACLTRYQNLIAHEALKAHGIYYFVPGMLQHFDTEAVVALIAPRPLLLMNGDQDLGSPVDGIRVIEQKVKPIYQLYAAQDEFQSQVHAHVGHEYLPVMWRDTLAWFDRHLKPQAPKTLSK